MSNKNCVNKMEKWIWSGFHRKTWRERQEALKISFPDVFPDEDDADGEHPVEFPLSRALPVSIADQMVENCVGVLSIPVGLAVNFNINGSHVLIPMAVEEPSVIAACNGAAKLVSACGGFQCHSHHRNTVDGHILIDIGNQSEEEEKKLVDQLNASASDFIQIMNSTIPKMLARGGGVLELKFEKLKLTDDFGGSRYWIRCEVEADVAEAMGANVITSLLEHVAPEIENRFRVKCVAKIVSNFNTKRLTTAKFSIPVDRLSYKGMDGSQVAQRIIDMYLWAKNDIKRATTYNKGIMNGVDAVALACGQDWRAIEAACHGFASINGYRPLSKYDIQNIEGVNHLYAELTLPIAVGTVGGAIKSNPFYSHALGLMKHPNSQQLAQFIVAVGIAQNFAALRALVSEGILRGHLSLHAKNICLGCNVPVALLPDVVQYMVHLNRFNSEVVHEYLDSHRIHITASKNLNPQKILPKPSVFVFSWKERTFSILFYTLTAHPVYIVLSEEPEANQSLLNGKSYSWFLKIFEVVNEIRINDSWSRKNDSRLKAKMISILLGILIRDLPDPISWLLSSLQTKSSPHHSDESSPAWYARNLFAWASQFPVGVDDTLIRGSLIVSLWQAFEYIVEEKILSRSLKKEIISQQRSLMNKALVLSPDPQEFYEVVEKVSGRFQMPIFLLLDLADLVDNVLAINGELIDWVVQLGKLLNIEVEIYHDLYRASSNMETMNVVQLWRKVDDGQKFDESKFLSLTIESDQHKRKAEAVFMFADQIGVDWNHEKLLRIRHLFRKMYQ